MAIAALDGVGSLQDQVRRKILQDIAEGRYAPSAQLLTEKEYAAQFGVSLITVRNALSSLVQAGYIERASGRGTFVSAPKVPYEIRLMSSSTDSLRTAGVPFDVRVIVAEFASPPDDVRRTMNLSGSARSFWLRRVVDVRGMPAILLESWVRDSAARAFEREPSFDGGSSLYSLLAREGIRLARADGHLKFAYANDDEAGHLRLPFGAPLFAYESTTWDDEDHVVERARALYDANRFSLRVSQEIDS
jgi:GntR family transcriptional regulator